jgi:hypothetical protein
MPNENASKNGRSLLRPACGLGAARRPPSARCRFRAKPRPWTDPTPPPIRASSATCCNACGARTCGIRRRSVRGSCPELRRVLDLGGRAEERLLAERNGLACAHRLSDLMDATIRTIHAAVIAHLYPSDNPSTAEHLAVVATGGYGRGTLAPGSDVDLLFLLPYKQTAWGESVVESILYVLWDLKLKVGTPTARVRRVRARGQADMGRSRTSLHRSRFRSGTKPVPVARVALRRRVVKGTAAEFVTQACASATRASPRPGVALPRRAERQGRQGRPARPQHAVLDRRSTSTASASPKSSSRRALHPGGVRPLRALRGVPVAGALPPAFRHRPRRGAPDLRPCRGQSRSASGCAARGGLSGVERFMKS